jgi:CheY-like chemotaxis protein
VLHANPRVLVLDDLPEKGRLLSRILISKGCSANSLTYPQNGLDEIKKQRPDLLILHLNFSEASIIRILQKVRENNPSLPIFVCADSVTKQLKNQETKLGVSGFFRKADVARSLCLEIRQPPVWAEQMLDQIKKLLLNNEGSGARHPSDLSK